VKINIWLFGIALCARGGVVNADNNVHFTGALISEPCEINGNQQINVDFGDNVITTDVSAGLVTKDITYTLDCSNAGSTSNLSMEISGTIVDFDQYGGSLETSIPELAIKLKHDGADFPLNKSLPFTAGSQPVLSALLIQEPGSHLPTGQFSASATMTVDYP